ncbi:MAG: hypothetical protein HC777_02905, partial [Hyphomonadaceae bacterium]|nr:hypothetical protein [Hyphomonadaceae bacterium]
MRRAGAASHNAALLEQRAQLSALKATLEPLALQAQNDARNLAKARAQGDQSRALAKSSRGDAPRLFAQLGLARNQVSRLENDLSQARARLDQAQTQVSAQEEEVRLAKQLLAQTEARLADTPLLQNDDELKALEDKVTHWRGLLIEAKSKATSIESAARAQVIKRTSLIQDIALWEKRGQQARAALTNLLKEQEQAQGPKAPHAAGATR